MMQDDIRWVKTHCGRMDHGGCALIVGVKNNKIVKIKGDPEGFLNKGFDFYISKPIDKKLLFDTIDKYTS